jgi:hypothetical protein
VAEILVHEVKGDGVLGFSTFFEIQFREPREAAHSHAHREVLCTERGSELSAESMPYSTTIIGPLNSDYFIDNCFVARY